MLRLVFLFIANVFLLPINLLLLIPRLIYKLVINNRAGVWIIVGRHRTTFEVDGTVKVR